VRWDLVDYCLKTVWCVLPEKQNALFYTTFTSNDMMVFPVLKKVFLSVHFYIVAGLVIYTLFPLTWPFNLPHEFWVKRILMHLLWAGLFYFNLLLLTPSLLFKNRVLLFISISLGLVMGMVYMNGFLDNVTGSNAAFAKQYNKKPAGMSSHDFYWTMMTAMVLLGISSIIAFYQKLKAHQAVIEATEQDKVNTELSLLKAQINPHFFFNTLHTIYGLSDTNPPASKDAIYTLSHMMRYVIYDTKNDMTTLEKELKFIEDYISLMRLRLTEGVQIIYEKQDGIRNYEVAPMLFLPFIENAFKHGISLVNPSYIYVDISQSGNEFKVEVKNSLFKEKAQFLEESNGIGIANTKRRLDLLYPGRYTLEVFDDHNTRDYSVILKLVLS
jgi:two-component system LytT family sensor kinase